MANGFDLDLQTVEQEITDADDPTNDGDGRSIVLGTLDGETDEREWFEVLDSGDVLVLAIEGNLAELATDLAPQVKERGGSLVHFRDFLIVTPASVDVDSDRL